MKEGGEEVLECQRKRYNHKREKQINRPGTTGDGSQEETKLLKVYIKRL